MLHHTFHRFQCTLSITAYTYLPFLLFSYMLNINAMVYCVKQNVNRVSPTVLLLCKGIFNHIQGEQWNLSSYIAFSVKKVHSRVLITISSSTIVLFEE